MVTDLHVATIGGEVLAEWGLRHNSVRQVIVISGNNAAQVRVRGARGRLSYLEKPFDLNELIRLIESLQHNGNGLKKRAVNTLSHA